MLQTESSPNFRPEFCPEFCSEFSPNFLRIFRASFRRRRRPEKNSPKNPCHFSMQNSQANTKKNIHRILLESRQSKKVLRQYCLKVFIQGNIIYPPFTPLKIWAPGQFCFEAPRGRNFICPPLCRGLKCFRGGGGAYKIWPRSLVHYPKHQNRLFFGDLLF